MKLHLDALIPHPFFKYVIFLRENKTFFGMIDARSLVAQLTAGLDWTYEKFTEAVNTGNGVDLVPGFVPAKESLNDQAQKQAALERMESAKTEWLPVINADGIFQGTVDQARLTASIVLDITNSLSSAQTRI